MLGIILNVTIPPGAKEIAYLLMGTLAAGFTQVLNFWLGSSKGSKTKDGIAAALARR